LSCLLVRLLIVELIYSGLNFIFDISVVFMINYFLVKDDVTIDNKTFLVADFINFKIKPAQSFRVVHRSKMCVHIFI
jgi:hypothetical protein